MRLTKNKQYLFINRYQITELKHSRSFFELVKMMTFELLSDLDGRNIIFWVGGLTIKHDYINMSVARHSTN